MSGRLASAILGHTVWKATSSASLSDSLCIWAASLALDAAPKLGADGVPPADVQETGNKSLSIFHSAVPDN